MPLWPDADGVEFEWSGTGILSVTADGLAAGHRRMPPSGNDGVSGVYFIRHSSQNQWEQSIGTWTAGTSTLTRGLGRIIGSNGTSLVSFNTGLKLVAFVAGSEDLGAGGVTINQVASGAVAYQFNVGGQYILPPDRKHRATKILGPADGALTASMYVGLPDPERAGEGYESVIRKGDTSTFGATVVGFDTPIAAAANAGTDVVTFTGYNPVAGDPIILDGDTAPGGLTLGVVYFARDVSGVTAKLAATVGGTAIDITTNGSGLVARKGVRTLTRQGHSVQARVTGKVAPYKWEQVAEGIRSSAFGQDLIAVADEPAARTLIGAQAADADLTALAALTTPATKLDLLSRLRRGLGAQPVLASGWVSGAGVTGDPNITAVAEAYGLTDSLAGTGNPQKLASGGVRVVANGTTSNSKLQRIANDLLTVRSLMTVDVRVNANSDWAGSSRLFGISDFIAGYGWYLSFGGISSMVSPSNSQLVIHALPSGRQRIAVYVDLAATPASFRMISLGIDGTVYQLNASWAGNSPDPAGQNVNLVIGNDTALAGRIGTHDFHGWRVINSIPAGMTTNEIDSLMLAEIDKLTVDSDPLLRQPAVPPDVEHALDITNTSGTVNADPTGDETRFYRLTGTLTGNLTIDLSVANQDPGPPVFVVWEGTNGAFKVIVQTHSGETVELTSTGWIVACYLDAIDPDAVVWRTMGRYKKNSEVIGGKFTRVINTDTALSPGPIVANAALDQTIQFLRGSSAVAVSLSENGGTNTQIVLVKQTDQVITVSVAGTAFYRLPGDDDSGSRTSSFVVTGTVTLIGDANSWLVIGATNHATTLYASLNAAGSEIYGQLSPWQAMGGTQAGAPSGRAWTITTNATAVPITNGWWAKVKNESGSPKTIQLASGGFVSLLNGATGTTLTLADDRGCFLHANGTNMMVDGPVTLA